MPSTAGGQSSISSFFKKKTTASSISIATDEKENGSKLVAPRPIKKAKIVESSSSDDDEAFEALAAAAEAKDITTTLKSSPLPYLSLATVFEKVENTSSRLEIQSILTDFFRHVIKTDSNVLLPVVYLCICTQLAPAFKGVTIGIGDSILIKAIADSTGNKPSRIKTAYNEEGDLGTVAEKLRGSQKTLGFIKPKPLSVKGVYDAMVNIANTSGNKSQDKKVGIIKKMLVSASKSEARFVIRGLQGKLRIGMSEKTILISLAHAFSLNNDKNEAEGIVKKAFSECPSFDIMIPALLNSSLDELHDACHLTPLIPVAPMLARPTKSYGMVFERFGTQDFTCEYKYDGERAQIHITDGKISIFSRNFEDSTERFPDVVSYISEISSVRNAIIDAEVVAVDRTSHKRLPFQVLSTRARKNVSLDSIKVPVCIYGFDLLYLNDESFLTKSLDIRRKTLANNFKVIPGKFELATSLDFLLKKEDEEVEEKVENVRQFLQQSVEDNCEGLMVKTLDGTYEPANRSHKWLKLKKDYLDGIGDSVDLVPVGAFNGRGKRTGVYGAFLLACYDHESEMFQLITKLGTGLSDDVLQKFYQELSGHVRDGPRHDYSVDATSLPDVWFEPTVVWEILGADLSISPKYTAAMGHVSSGKGISLRFPRFIRERSDKNPTDATDAAQIADLYRAQGLNGDNNDNDNDDDEDAL